jgi:hypothetical protein
MGSTEWGLLVPVARLRAQVTEDRGGAQHEDFERVGEELKTVGILKYETASKAARSWKAFFQMRRKWSDLILGVDEKPKNWLDCEEFVWRAILELCNEKRYMPTYHIQGFSWTRAQTQITTRFPKVNQISKGL